MNIQTVRDNLKIIISGKEKLLERSMERLGSHYKDRMDSDTWFSIKTTVDFLEVNIAELRRILADVEQCIPPGTRLYDARHGGPYDRGSADSYYGRGYHPHYYVGATSVTARVEISDMTAEEIAAYIAGFDDNEQAGDKKDWS